GAATAVPAAAACYGAGHRARSAAHSLERPLGHPHGRGDVRSLPLPHLPVRQRRFPSLRAGRAEPSSAPSGSAPGLLTARTPHDLSHPLHLHLYGGTVGPQHLLRHNPAWRLVPQAEKPLELLSRLLPRLARDLRPPDRAGPLSRQLQLLPPG